MGEDVIGGRCSSWQAMVSVKNSHRSARARPPPADTPDESSAVTTSQITPSIQDFAVSLTEVSLIWLEFRRIYRAAHPPLADSLVLFDRWLPGVLRRVRQITDRCTGIDGCISIRPG